MFCSSKDMLLHAQRRGYAVCAFNAENMEMVQAIISAAEATNAPVIIQTTPGTLSYAPAAAFAGVAANLAAKAKVPVALHLDHGKSIAMVQECINVGYTSVMIDGSLLPFAENVAITKTAVHLAGDIPVEAELGTVGGKEDDHSAGVQYTDPADAARFVASTGVFSFAPAIGTAHGIYSGTPVLDVKRLRQIHKLVEVPLVLHGTSGVPDETVRKCIDAGIRKVNYATELRIAFSEGVKEYLAANPDAFDPKKYLGAGRKRVEEQAIRRIELCGGVGKSGLE